MELEKLALQDALERLDKWNRRYLADFETADGTLPVGYSDALIRDEVVSLHTYNGESEKAGSYRYVHGKKGGPGEFGAFGGTFTKRDQVQLIEHLGLVAKVQGGSKTFIGDEEIDKNLPLLDALRSGGILQPSTDYNREEPHERYSIVARFKERCGNRAGPHVGPALNLIAFAILTGLHDHLKENGIVRVLLERLLSEKPTDFTGIDDHDIAAVQGHHWCASVPDLDDPTNPPIALIYTVAGCQGDACDLHGHENDILRNTIEAGYVFHASHSRRQGQAESAPTRRGWSWASDEEIARSVFSEAVKVSGISFSQLQAWSDAKDNEGRVSTERRGLRAKEIIKSFVEIRRKEAEEEDSPELSKEIAQFIFRHFYGIRKNRTKDTFWSANAAREDFLRKAKGKLKD
ncbi:MAG: hypothetical protein QOD42_252 [Sphingomonadales bacterium]|jgi:hypothetical protein|nr:hypothetical protein [Sphingomonadales bacterium]